MQTQIIHPNLGLNQGPCQ